MPGCCELILRNGIIGRVTSAGAGAIPTPHRGDPTTVAPEWIDENGHFNAGFYVVAFDLAITAWMAFIGLDDDHRAEHEVTTFTAQNHVAYLRELAAGDEFRVDTQLLGFDRKRVHAVQLMVGLRDDAVSATCEVLSLHVSERTRRVSEMADGPFARLERVWAAHRHLEVPDQVGRPIGLRGG